jgi:prepilin-type processing-associated H-X9-DG protein
MDERRSTSRVWEGVETNRHSGTGATAFNDGHVEFRRDSQINPPYDPVSGNPHALTNANYWDPLQRGR